MNRRATLDALAAIVLWSALATLAVRLRQVPPFLLVGVALLLGSLIGLRCVSWRGGPAEDATFDEGRLGLVSALAMVLIVGGAVLGTFVRTNHHPG